jgi:hypothetical protein
MPLLLFRWASVRWVWDTVTRVSTAVGQSLVPGAPATTLVSTDPVSGRSATVRVRVC